jgi:hypothetical protein
LVTAVESDIAAKKSLDDAVGRCILKNAK